MESKQNLMKGKKKKQKNNRFIRNCMFHKMRVKLKGRHTMFHVMRASKKRKGLSSKTILALLKFCDGTFRSLIRIVRAKRKIFWQWKMLDKNKIFNDFRENLLCVIILCGSELAILSDFVSWRTLPTETLAIETFEVHVFKDILRD